MAEIHNLKTAKNLVNVEDCKSPDLEDTLAQTTCSSSLSKITEAWDELKKAQDLAAYCHNKKSNIHKLDAFILQAGGLENITDIEDGRDITLCIEEFDRICQEVSQRATENLNQTQECNSVLANIESDLNSQLSRKRNDIESLEDRMHITEEKIQKLKESINRHLVSITVFGLVIAALFVSGGHFVMVFIAVAVVCIFHFVN